MEVGGIAQDLLKDFKVHSLFSLQLGVRCVLLAVTHEASDKSLHSTSTPDCTQREKGHPRLSHHWGGVLGTVTKPREDNSAEVRNQSQNKINSLRSPRSLGTGTKHAMGGGSRLSGLHLKGQVALGTLGLCHLANLGGDSMAS